LNWEDKLEQKQATTLLAIAVFLLATIAFIQPADPNTLQPQIDQWTAHPMYISPYAGSATPIGYTPDQIRKAYNLPTSGGEGTTIAIIDAYDTPNILSYFNTFSAQYNLPDNSTGNFLVHKMAQNMNTDSNWAMETCLDVEWAHAIAPNATILLVEATAPSSTALLAAIDYATSQPGVVAVSMSWGGPEFSGEISYFNYERHFDKPGIAFFASSGDDGSYVNWPAVSPNVVSVGGTTLTLNSDGTVISETAWRNSSGGFSSYFATPSFQTNFGLTYPGRAVPDVSYDGNASTGVAVYNGLWWQVGGTSAGAPQWAAIHALGLSATNDNLYARAKSAYASYFRDIINGSNYVYSASPSYDLVTGLGSPLTTNFGTYITLSPTAQQEIVNNTDLTGSVFVQTGDSLNVTGNGFDPGVGTATLFWDDLNVTTTEIDDNGSFSANVTVPQTNTGPHTLSINDGSSDFCVNLTRVPSTANNYTSGWQTSDFTIALTPDSAVNETFYRINGGNTQNVTADGQPLITVEGANNTLEYWSTWNTSSSATIELPHVILSEIKLDKTPPTGTISTDPTTATADITLTLFATDTVSGVAQMRFSNDNASWSDWETYATSKSWTLQGGDGVKTVYVQYSDNAGLDSTPYSCMVTLQTPQPMPTPQSTVAPTATPTVAPTTEPSATVEPSPTPAIPELSLLAVLVLMALSGLLSVVVFRRRK